MAGYQRAWLRGDVIAGPGRRHRGDPAGDGLRDHRRAAGRDRSLHVHAADDRVRRAGRRPGPQRLDDLDDRRSWSPRPSPRCPRRPPRTEACWARPSPSPSWSACACSAMRLFRLGSLVENISPATLTGVKAGRRAHGGGHAAAGPARGSTGDAGGRGVLRKLADALAKLGTPTPRPSWSPSSRSPCSWRCAGGSPPCPGRWSWSPVASCSSPSPTWSSTVSRSSTMSRRVCRCRGSRCRRRPRAPPRRACDRRHVVPGDGPGRRAQPQRGKSRPSTATRSCLPSASPRWPGASPSPCRRRAASPRPRSTSARGPDTQVAGLVTAVLAVLVALFLARCSTTCPAPSWPRW